MNKTTNKAKKKKLIKIVLVVASVFLVLALLAWVLPMVIENLNSDSEDYSYNEWLFFEPDYNKNILEDEIYLSLNRGIHYNRYGDERVLTEDMISDQHISAQFFYDYFDCIVRGDYQNYPSFYTERCLNDENFNLPERFTMQGIYDINVILHSVVGDEATGKITEYYEVSYRIFENNGTYRRDILPDETRTRVFEIEINGGEAKINSITHRQTVK